MDDAAPVLWTIGHSNVKAEVFLAALEAEGIEALVDVRTTPRSRFAPWSNRDRLEALLAERGIAYVWEGEALGGKPSDPSVLRDGAPDYGLIAERDWFRAGMAGLEALARERRVAVMCSEEDPAKCHRRGLIAVNLPREWRVVDVRTGGGKGIRAEEMERQLAL